MRQVTCCHCRQINSSILRCMSCVFCSAGQWYFSLTTNYHWPVSSTFSHNKSAPAIASRTEWCVCARCHGRTKDAFGSSLVANQSHTDDEWVRHRNLVFHISPFSRRSKHFDLCGVVYCKCELAPPSLFFGQRWLAYIHHMAHRWGVQTRWDDSAKRKESGAEFLNLLLCSGFKAWRVYKKKEIQETLVLR